MNEMDLIVDNSTEKELSKKRRRKVGFIWILIGLSCFIVKRVIRFVDFNLMLKNGIENGISSTPLGFLCTSLFWAAIISLCFTIALILFFFDLDKVKAGLKKIVSHESLDSNNSEHY